MAVVSGQIEQDVSEYNTARQFWIRVLRYGEIVRAELPPRQVDEVLVRTLYSAVSRGTESLVFKGEVPSSQYEAMRHDRYCVPAAAVTPVPHDVPAGRAVLAAKYGNRRERALGRATVSR